MAKLKITVNSGSQDIATFVTEDESWVETTHVVIGDEIFTYRYSERLHLFFVAGEGIVKRVNKLEELFS